MRCVHQNLGQKDISSVHPRHWDPPASVCLVLVVAFLRTRSVWSRFWCRVVIRGDILNVVAAGLLYVDVQFSTCKKGIISNSNDLRKFTLFRLFSCWWCSPLSCAAECDCRSLLSFVHGRRVLVLVFPELLSRHLRKDILHVLGNRLFVFGLLVLWPNLCWSFNSEHHSAILVDCAEDPLNSLVIGKKKHLTHLSRLWHAPNCLAVHMCDDVRVLDVSLRNWARFYSFDHCAIFL